MNHGALTLAVAAAVLGTITPTRADLLFYEGFNYTDGTQLHGQGGWSNDPNDTYDATGAEVWDGVFTGVTRSGNFAGNGGRLFVTRSLDSSVTETFAAGSAIWLSFINYRTSSRGAAVSIGAGPLTGDRSLLTDDTAPYWRDSSVSPSDFGFHWNHNAEIHYLIGKGIAEGMKTLLP